MDDEMLFASKTVDELAINLSLSDVIQWEITSNSENVPNFVDSLWCLTHDDLRC
jgi:hypothetical protein